ncbi:MAG: radical SAM protein, partial [Oligoflexia bacterium]|nr:radical SAM protein [Oligoflexia bacterium]
RYRSVKSVVDEIELCIKEYDIGEFNFHDEVFTMDKRRTIEICREIRKRKLKFPWVCMARADSLTEELLEEMKLAGCRKINFGFESGSKMILEIMKKKMIPEKALEAVKLTHRARIKTAGNFMLGNIGETEETIRQTIDFAKKLNCDTSAFFIASPFPGTELYTQAKEKGYLRNNLEWKNFCTLSKNRPTMNLPNLTSERIQELHRQAYKEYYFRLKYIWKKLTGINSFTEVKNLVNGFLLLLKIRG